MKRIASLLAVLCLMLTGCSWMDGSYVSVKDHREQISGVQSGTLSASNYQQLRAVLEQMVQSGTETAVVNVAQFDQERVDVSMESAIRYIQTSYPLGAYAVDQVSYEIGTGVGHPAIFVEISYVHGRSEIRKVQGVRDMEGAQKVIAEAMEDCSEGVVILIQQYSETDLVQMVEDYAELHPNTVMETPQVAVGLYPDIGDSRVVELKFTYQTSRDSLRQMQTQVRRVFASAALYVSSDGTEAQKYLQLYNFLMERFDYQQGTSITPSYSLLNHGVGDCEAFAMVYAAMCVQAELECHIISGTRDGEPWYWNMIREDGVYYHVDLLRSNESGGFTKYADARMQGYVWDYSAFPVGDAVPETTEKIIE